MSNAATVFQQIWDGTIPSFPLFRSDEHGVQVLLDIFPAQPGHMLVIPREPVDHVFELEPYRYLQLFAVSQTAAKQMKDVLKPLRVMHIVSGYDIPHVHVHLLPSYKRGDTEASLLSGREGRRAADEALQAMQEKLRFSPELAHQVEAQLAHIASRPKDDPAGADVRSLMSKL